MFDILIFGRYLEQVTGMEWLYLLPHFVEKRACARGRVFDFDSVTDKRLRRPACTRGNRWIDLGSVVNANRGPYGME